MSRNGRRQNGTYAHDPEGIEDNNGILHTTSRSLRKINYAEIESGFDYLENEEVMSATETLKDVDQEKVPNDNDNGIESDPDENDVVVHRNYRGSTADISPESRRSRGIDRSRGRTGRRSRAVDTGEDDESFHEDEDMDADADEDELDLDDDDKDDDYYVRNDAKRRRKLEDKSFVVPDPEEGDEDEEDDDEDENSYPVYNRRRKRSSNTNDYRITRRMRNRDSTPPPPSRNLRRKTRSSHMDDGLADSDIDQKENDALSLEDEIRELQEDSPVQEKRSLRERTKPVNYQLPPPLTDANAEEHLAKGVTATFPNPSPRRGRGGWNASQNMGPIRRLFPTGGPFGGNDVTTVFGKNTNFYGQGRQSLNTNNGGNNKLLDSDSSEDEILPLGATPTQKKPKSKKKKPEIADLDPLGVDMNVKFSEVGGLDNYIDQLKEMVALPLLYPELYQNFNITPPRGVLFHGPPGTGKTLMARALAASCSSEGRGITFFMRKGADVLSKWVGEAERQLRLLFEEAKKHQPSVIFFDEIDGLAPVRSSKQEQIHASIVSTLLALMDGMDNRGQVIVIGATNRPDAVDPALRRPGRFDREFYFPLPDSKARTQILKIHTKKWEPPLSEDFVSSLSSLTKGYGGADLRALCTEAALISIQRKYPQIYRSNDKLHVDPSQVKVNSGDFMIALKRIVPSSARSAGSTAQPLPDSVKPLLENQFQKVKDKLQQLIPEENDIFRKDSSLIQHFIDYESFDEGTSDNNKSNGDMSGFAKYELVNKISDARVCQPKLLITGPRGNGQQYIGAAILNYFERYNVQKLDLASLVSDNTKTIESAVVQTFIEARKRQPSVLYIPSIEIWSNVIPEVAILTLSSLMRSLQSSEKVFILGIGEATWKSELKDGPLSNLFLSKNTVHIDQPSLHQRTKYFGALIDLIRMKPTNFETVKKRKEPLEPLPLADVAKSVKEHGDNGEILSPKEVMRKNLRSFQHQDMKLKNVLKIKLSGLMDLFKNRYKRFRKPPIDDSFLIHLFEPSTDPNWEPAYTKDNDMILEVATGRRFFNMDLDLVEERLWNGYYSEPKQYLKDIELIHRDANTIGDRERIIKASEMFANAQMGIEEISTPEFIQECKATRKRDIERQELFLEDEQKSLSEEREHIDDTTVLQGSANEIGVAAGNQLQAQICDENSKNIDELKEHSDVIFRGDKSKMQDSENSGPDTTVETVKVLAQDEGAANQSGSIETTNSNDISNNNIDSPINDQNGDTVSSGVSGVVAKITCPDTPNIVTDTECEAAAKIPTDVKNTDSETCNAGDSNEFNNSEYTHIVKNIENTENSENIDKAATRNGSSELEIGQSNLNPEKEVELDNEALMLIIQSLEQKTENYTVSKLEETYSDLVELAWEDRFSWNKLNTITRILQRIENI